MIHKLVPTLLIALLALTLSGTALAHADLVASTPADGATLAAAPERVVLVFSEELKADGNLVTVTDASGAQVDRGDTALDLNDPKRVTLTVSLRSGLGAGAYTISWKNASTDGHSEEGTLSFQVGAAAAPTALPSTGAGGAPDLAWPLALALALAVAGLSLRRRAGRTG